MEREEYGAAGLTSGDVVVRDGCVHWHTRPTCDVRDAREGPVAYLCGLRDAWASCLLPCPSCAGRQVTLAVAAWGEPTRVERARLSLPVLQDLVTGLTILPTSAPRAGARSLPPLPVLPAGGVTRPQSASAVPAAH